MTPDVIATGAGVGFVFAIWRSVDRKVDDVRREVVSGHKWRAQEWRASLR